MKIKEATYGPDHPKAKITQNLKDLADAVNGGENSNEKRQWSFLKGWQLKKNKKDALSEVRSRP